MASELSTQEPEDTLWITPELRNIARQAYDEQRFYFECSPGMVDQIRRNGILVNKAGDKDGYLRFRGTRNYYRDERSHTPNGSRIIHREDDNPYPDQCTAFIHPPYDSHVQYKGEKGAAHTIETDLAKLGEAAATCGFCAIMYRGIQAHRHYWISYWAQIRWREQNPNFEILTEDDAMAWLMEYIEEVTQCKPIDETEILLHISFPKSDQLLNAHMMLERKPQGENNRREPLADVQFYIESDKLSKWNSILPGSHISSEILSEACVEKLNSWISNCELNHPNCSPLTGPGLPSRLLEIYQGEDQDHPRLKVVDTSRKQTYKYVALSHVWSKTDPLRTTAENISNHRNRIPWKDLSKAIQDAINVTKALGICYIWIDSMCIIQDDPIDWEAEAPRMGLVYANAHVVFAAVSNTLALSKHPPEPVIDPIHPENDPVYSRIRVDHSFMNSDPQSTDSWMGRAWCMQERIFARRLLVFGGTVEEITFECLREMRCECGEINKDHDINVKLRFAHALAGIQENENDDQVRDQLWKAYWYSCEDYTARGLTYTSDMLPACSSVMSCLGSYLGKYYAGLWERHLIFGLQWEVLDTMESFRHKEYVAPSFSWASQTGGVIWYAQGDLPSSATHDFATILDVSCTPSGHDTYGKVANGYITVQSFLTEMNIKDRTMLHPDGRMRMEKEGVDGCWVTLDSATDAYGVHETDNEMLVYCLDIMRDKVGPYASGLVLLPIDLSKNTFRRIGFSTMKQDHFQGCDRKVVTIV